MRKDVPGRQGWRVGLGDGGDAEGVSALTKSEARRVSLTAGKVSEAIEGAAKEKHSVGGGRNGRVWACNCSGRRKFCWEFRSRCACSSGLLDRKSRILRRRGLSIARKSSILL